MWGRLRDPWVRRKDLSAQGLHIPTGGKLPASAIHNVQLLAALVVLTGVGVSSEVFLENLLGGLIPDVPFSRGQVAFVRPSPCRAGDEAVNHPWRPARAAR